jgi:glycosyltransferase domain-containing protein
VNPAIARLIEGGAAFPNLQIEYRRYNDLSFRDFYLKIQDALSSIKTPYVMMSDNDDFLFPSGIIASVDYLERSPGYVSAGGGVGHFESADERNQLPHLSGKIQRFWFQQSRNYQAYDLESGSAADRVDEAYSGFLTVCYNVFRVEALRKIAVEAAGFNFRRLDNQELYWILRAATLGKIKSLDSCMSYLRQLGTSSNPSRGKDFVVSVSSETYVDEIQRIAKQIAAIAAQADGADAGAIGERLNAIAAARLREKLVAVLGWRATVKETLKRYVPQVLLACMKAVGDRLRSGASSAAGGRPISREEMLNLMASAGASASLLAETQRELAAIEHTMASGDFIAFVEASAPDLLRREMRAVSERIA